jgi:hypothetical protein
MKNRWLEPKTQQAACLERLVEKPLELLYGIESALD